MTESLAALLSNLIDYAGLFPPAKLPLETALRNYVRYQSEPDRWMLGRFICPAARLAEIPEDLLPAHQPLVISALGRGAPPPRFLDFLGVDLADIAACRQKFAGRVVIDVFEVKVPADETARLLAEAGELLGQTGLAPFFEPSLDVFPGLVRQMTGGVKLRCGGLEAAAFPSPAEVAGVLTRCVSHRLPFKATAGLHHPLRHIDHVLQTMAHGFINVFAAGVLATVLHLDAEQVQMILADENASHFDFTDAGLRYGDWFVRTPGIVEARRRIQSYGSCSFDEPREDLRALGWLK